jgi:hypothetical protein
VSRSEDEACAAYKAQTPNCQLGESKQVCKVEAELCNLQGSRQQRIAGVYDEQVWQKEQLDGAQQQAVC